MRRWSRNPSAETRCPGHSGGGRRARPRIEPPESIPDRPGRPELVRPLVIDHQIRFHRNQFVSDDGRDRVRIDAGPRRVDHLEPIGPAVGAAPEVQPVVDELGVREGKCVSPDGRGRTNERNADGVGGLVQREVGAAPAERVGREPARRAQAAKVPVRRVDARFNRVEVQKVVKRAEHGRGHVPAEAVLQERQVELEQP